MFKKIIYPFTDWAWLKLTLAVMVMSALATGFVTLFFGAVLLMEPKQGEQAMPAIAFVVLIGLVLATLVFFGYLKRVARQPELDPLKLPPLKAPFTLAKEGFLTCIGAYLSTMLAQFLVMVPIMILGAIVVGGRALFGTEAHAIVNTLFVFGLAGTTMLYILAIIFLVIWLSFFAPLLAVRYSYTGRFRSFFEFRWAWNAFTIAPMEYLARTMAWSILLIVITVLTPVTAGMAWILAYILGPYSTVNCAYLMGDYYNVYLND